MPTYAKALVSVVSTALAQLAVIMVGPTSTFGQITAAQWVAIASATVISGTAVYGIRNGVSTDPTTSTPEVDPQDPEFGYGLVEAVVGVLLVVLLVLLILRIA